MRQFILEWEEQDRDFSEDTMHGFASLTLC